MKIFLVVEEIAFLYVFGGRFQTIHKTCDYFIFYLKLAFASNRKKMSNVLESNAVVTAPNQTGESTEVVVQNAWTCLHCGAVNWNTRKKCGGKRNGRTCGKWNPALPKQTRKRKQRSNEPTSATGATTATVSATSTNEARPVSNAPLNENVINHDLLVAPINLGTESIGTFNNTSNTTEGNSMQIT